MRVKSVQRLARQHWDVILLIALSLVVATPYLHIAFTTAENRPVAPLDDAYITLQYARHIVKGHFYHYNTQDPPTTGMTSMLYGLLMAAFYKVGFMGESLVGVSVATGVLWFATSVLLTYRLTWQLLPPHSRQRRWALMAALLMLLAGAAHWGFFNGMETGLFTAVTLAALLSCVSDKPGWSAFWLSVAGLIRPEGLLLAGIVLFSTFLDLLLRHRLSRWRELILPALAILPGLVPSLLNWILTGTPSGTGLQTKTWIYSVPAHPKAILYSMASSYRDILVGSFAGWNPPIPGFVPPGLLWLMLPMWWFLGQAQRWKSMFLMGLWFFGAALASATLMTATWHLGRYQAPLIPVAFSLTAGGLAWLEQGAKRKWQYAVLGLCCLYLIGSSLYALPSFLGLYRRAARTTVNQQLVLADWLREHLPLRARVGVHDAGTLRYVGERPTYDLVGLTTPKAGKAWRHGAGSAYELMENSPLRPDYFAICPDIFSLPYLVDTGLVADRLLLVNVPYASMASADSVQGIWRANWSLANSGTAFYQPDILFQTQNLELIDALDVADLKDEAAHHVRWWQNELNPGFPTEVHQLTYRVDPTREVIDGGRLLNGGLTFQTISYPEHPLWLVARLHAHRGGGVYVKVGGEVIGRWAYPQVAGQWLETMFRIPAKAIDGTQTEITLEVDTESTDGMDYAPYYFWVLQGKAVLPEPKIDHQLQETRFGRHISLLGFDLAKTTWQAGSKVPLTLYWQTDAEVDLDMKVFVHLYDPRGDIVTQADGRPYFGTRPPYTWRPGQIIEDPVTLTVPSNLPPGQYSVKAGLYHPNGSGRLAAYQKSVPHKMDAIALTMLQIE